LVLLGTTLGAGLLGGCAAPTDTGPAKDRGYSFWPQFPAEPRVQFLVSYRYSSDITPAQSRFDDLIYGKDSGVLPINKPYGVEFWNGRIYVCDIKNPGVVVLDLAKKQTRVMRTNGLGGMQQPTDIAIAEDGTKYVADAVRGVVFVFDANERHTRSFGRDGFKPVGVAVDGDRLYVSDFTSNRVLIMDRADGTVIGEIGEPGGEDGQFVRPLGVGTTPSGDVVVGDVIRCRLQVFGPSGELLNAVGQIGDTAGSFVRPKHLDVDEDGLIYVVDASFNNVQVFNEKGQVLMFFGSSGTHPGAMDLPAGLAISETGLEYFKPYIHPAFQAERLIFVTNQFGANKVSVYAMGQLAEGFTTDDIISVVPSAEPSGEPVPGVIPLEDVLPGEPETPAETPAETTGEPAADGDGA